MENMGYPMCGAKTRSGATCRQFAMPNGRCYYHGGASKSGRENGRYQHGYYTKEAIEERKRTREAIRTLEKLMLTL